MILVTGATGQLGQSTVQALLDQDVLPNDIVALVRDADKATYLKQKGIDSRVGDYNDYASLQKAMHNIDKVFFISSSDMINDRFVQHKNLIDAAIESQVRHLVYTAIDIKSLTDSVIPQVTQIHLDTINYLKKTNLAYTILNNTLYADLIPLFIGSPVLNDVICFPAGEGKVPFVPRTEMAAASTTVLTSERKSGIGKTYFLSGETAYSFEEIASLLSEISGREVKYRPDANAYVEQLTKNGVPTEAANFLAGFGTAISQGAFETNRSDLNKLLGRTPTYLKTYLKEVYAE